MISINKYGQNIDLSKLDIVNGKKSFSLNDLVLNNMVIIKVPAGTGFKTTLVEEDLKIEFKESDGNIFELILKDMATLLAKNSGKALLEIVQTESGIKLASISDITSALEAAAAGGEESSDSSISSFFIDEGLEFQNNITTNDRIDILNNNRVFEPTTSVDRNNAPSISEINAQNTNEDTTLLIPIRVVDPDVDELILNASANNGVASIENEVITYIPNENFNGSDLITLSVNDGTVTVIKTIDITVNPINDNPEVDVVSTIIVDEDSSQIITFKSSDVDGDTLFSTANAENGEVVINGNEITYTPNANYNGSDLIILTTDDRNGGVLTKTINVTVTPINDLPIIDVDSSLYVIEEESTTLTFLARDIDGDNLSSTVKAQNGEVVINGNEITYTPNTNYNGSDVITLTIDDGNGGIVVKTIDVTVGGQNDAPEIDIVSTLEIDEDTSKTITFLSNDVDGDIINVIAKAENGIVEISGNEITYTPNTNYNGSDVITLTPNDGKIDGETKIINVKVNPINDAPISIDDLVGVSIIESINDVTPTNGSAIKFEFTTTTENEVISLDWIFSSYDYMPINDFAFYQLDNQMIKLLTSINNENFNSDSSILESTGINTLSLNIIEPGTHTLIFGISNSEDISANSYLEISDIPNNLLLVDKVGIIEDNLTSKKLSTENGVDISTFTINVGENDSVFIDVLSNDYDIDSDSNLFILNSFTYDETQGGSILLINNQLQFNPEEDFNYLKVGEKETVVVSYTMSDDKGATSSSTAMITITGSNDAPTVTSSNIIVKETELTEATLDLLKTIVTDEDGIVSLDISTSNAFVLTLFQQYGAENIIKKAISVLLPTVLEDNISINIDTSINGTISANIEISGLPSNPFASVVSQANLKLILLDKLGSAYNLPFENAVYTGQIQVADSDNIQDVKLTLGNIELNVSTTNKYLITFFEQVSSPQFDLTSLQELAGELLNGTIPASTTNSLNISLPQTLVDSLQKAGLLNIILDDSGEYKIVSALFNFMKNTDSAEVSFTYSANDGESDSNIGTTTVTIEGTNDSPVAFDDNVSINVDGNLSYEGYLPGSYNINMFSTIYNLATTYSTNISSAINQDEVKDALKTVLADDIDLSSFSKTELLSGITNLVLESLSKSSSFTLPLIIKTTIEDVLGTLSSVEQVALSNSINSFVNDALINGSVTTSSLETFKLSLFSLYNTQITAIETNIQTVIFQTVATTAPSAVITQLNVKLLDAIESSLGDLKGQEQLALKSKISTFITSYMAVMTNPVAAKGVLTNFESDLVDLYIVSTLNNDFTSVLTAISGITSSITSLDLSGLSLSNILEKTIDSIDVLNTTNLNTDLVSILKSALDTITTYISSLQLAVLISDTNAIENTFKGLLDSLFTEVNNVLDNILLTQVDSSTVIDIVKSVLGTEIATIISSNISSLIVQLNGLGFDSTAIANLTNSINSYLVNTLTGNISVNIDELKITALENVFTQLGLDTGLLHQDTRDTIAVNMVQDVYERLSLDEDFVDIGTIDYYLDGTPSVVVYDKDGNEFNGVINGIDTTTLATDTMITINKNGSYSLVNDSFDSISSEYSIDVSFDYYIDDQNGLDGTDGVNESSNSLSKTVTLSIDLTDIYSSEANNDAIDMSSLLQNTSGLDVIDMSEGSHILSNFTLDEFIALTDEDNTLKIFGDSADKIELDSAQNWTQMMQIDGTTPYTNAEGFYVYTTTANDETLKLLIENSISVENI